MESINERILSLIELKNLNKSSFCSKVEIKPQTLHNIISGRKTKPSFDVLKKILEHFSDVNAEWLIKGKGEPFFNITNKNMHLVCLECNYREYKIIEMEREVYKLERQIQELTKDKEELKEVLHILD